jgi:hypothetical protein
MIPKGATDTPPRASGAQRIYLPRKRGATVFWAFWSAERAQWSLPYHGTANLPPSFESMQATGHLKLGEPGVMLHWLNLDGDQGSDSHLERAISNGE